MKINIVRQDSLKFRKAARIRTINAVVTVGSISLFALSVLLTSGQFIYLGFRNRQLTGQIKTLGDLYNARSKDRVEYVAVKQIIDTVDRIQSSRFKYRDFLNAIYKLLPSRAKLSSVDFGKPGVVVVGVRLQTLDDYDAILVNINNGWLDNDFLFSAAAQPSLRMDKAGQHLVTLELMIK
ncbi:hypothetical protein HYU90_03330 [Candidatus Collierbacteria bacterium]|nr:hypothetical protein [Candidatus Collierbacteria bacterium]